MLFLWDFVINVITNVIKVVRNAIKTFSFYFAIKKKKKEKKEKNSLHNRKTGLALNELVKRNNSLLNKCAETISYV